MRNRLCAFTVLLLAACAANAEMLFYKGLMNLRHSGDGADTRQTFRAWIIVDHDSGAVARIDYYPSGNFYSIEADQVLTTNLVRLPQARTATVLAGAGQTEGGTAVTVSATFARGNNARLQVARNTYTAFPRVLDWSSRSVGPAGDPPATETSEETGVLTLDGSTTIASNNKAETLADAKVRIAKHLESLGYRQIIVK